MLLHVGERLAAMVLLKVDDKEHQPCGLHHKARIP